MALSLEDRTEIAQLVADMIAQGAGGVERRPMPVTVPMNLELDADLKEAFGLGLEHLAVQAQCLRVLRQIRDKAAT